MPVVVHILSKNELFIGGLVNIQDHQSDMWMITQSAFDDQQKCFEPMIASNFHESRCQTVQKSEFLFSFKIEAIHR